MQQVLQKSTDFLRRIIAPVEGRGERSRCRACATTVTGARLKIASFGSPRSMETAARSDQSSVAGGARRAGEQYNCKAQNGGPGYSRQRGTQRGGGSSGSCATAGSVRWSRGCSQTASQFAIGRGQPDRHDPGGSAGRESRMN